MPLSSSSVLRSVLLLGLPLAWLWFRLLDHLRLEWTVNEQYAYGWAVPFLCLYLLWRRWSSFQPSSGAPASGPAPVGRDPVEPSGVQSSKLSVDPAVPWSRGPVVPASEAPLSASQPFSVSASPGAPDSGPAAVQSSKFEVESSMLSSRSLPLRALVPSWFLSSPFSFSAFQLFSFFILAAFLLTRWIEVANPDWRLVSWALALEVIGFTLLMLRLAFGVAAARHLAFPILFFLVAVPWPTGIEQPLIQALTRGIVAVTVELLNAFGIAAVPHGNVIETAGGLVDIDEACSGIRSLQAVLMLALFFGELSRFSAKRRGALCLVAFALAAVFNLARTLTLSFVASQRGPAAVESWHDPAGIAILVGCFIGVWAVAAWMARRPTAAAPSPAAVSAFQRFSVSAFVNVPFTISLAALLLVGELAVHFWYASAAPAPAPDWTAKFPTNNPSFNVAEIPSSAEKILRFNEGRSGTWLHPDGTRWQMIYLRWLPGRVATTLARNHTPEICLPAAGRNLRGMSNIAGLEAGGMSLPFRSFTTGPEGRPLFVFYTLWEDGAREQRNATQLLTRPARLRAVLERRRNPGQRVLQIAVWGARDEAHAVELLRAELPELIQQNAEAVKR